MQAVYIRQHGPIADLKVSEIPKPSPRGGDELLVRVEASGINPSDLVSVEGRFPDAVLPRVVGRDFAGTVVEGPQDLMGVKVWGSGGDLGVSRDGTHAEYLAITRRAAGRRPGNLLPEEAAAVGVPFITAFSALVRLGQVRQREWVIVSGAAGAVGQAAIEIAHAKGARVIALLRDARERRVSDSPKVEAFAQSDQGNLEAVTRKVTNGKGADLALNGVGSGVFASMLGALAVGGRQIVYSVAGGKDATVDLLMFYKHAFSLFGLDTQKFDAICCARILQELDPLFESGEIDPPKIGARFPLVDAPEAYSRVAQGKSGKVVLLMT
ncbi:MAG TPA: zinc-binding alcohol dehydrogenase family protein [Candidatus Cybelea sp.]|nr:zinc-binding alcohol dehydrogenase family protein [Candidatus Cybelea sp.]